MDVLYRLPVYVRASNNCDKQKTYLVQYPLSEQQPHVLANDVEYKPKSDAFRYTAPLNMNHYDSDRGQEYGDAVSGAPHLLDQASNGQLSGIAMSAQKLINGRVKSGTHAMAVLCGGAIHLSALDAVLQVRPDLSHVDSVSSAQLQEEGEKDETDVSDEDVKPVAVKAAPQRKGDASDFNQALQSRRKIQREFESENWIRTKRVHLTTDRISQILLCTDEDKLKQASLSTQPIIINEKMEIEEQILVEDANEKKQVLKTERKPSAGTKKGTATEKKATNKKNPNAVKTEEQENKQQKVESSQVREHQL